MVFERDVQFVLLSTRATKKWKIIIFAPRKISLSSFRRNGNLMSSNQNICSHLSGYQNPLHQTIPLGTELPKDMLLTECIINWNSATAATELESLHRRNVSTEVFPGNILVFHHCQIPRNHKQTRDRLIWPIQDKSMDEMLQTEAVEGPAPGGLSCCTLQLLNTRQCDLEWQTVLMSACLSMPTLFPLRKLLIQSLDVINQRKDPIENILKVLRFSEGLVGPCISFLRLL